MIQQIRSNKLLPAATTEKLLSNDTPATTATVCPTAVPPGAVMLFAVNTAPTGWLKANGAAISRTAYAGLFAAIGTIAGEGDGSTTFNVPDVRGEFFRGWDDSRGVDMGRVLGSAQSGTSHPHIAVYADNATSGVLLSPSVNAYPSFPSTNEPQFEDGSDSAAIGGYLSVGLAVIGGVNTGRWYRSRPRNVAFLACIKY